MSDTYANLAIERHADGYALVTLNRPEALNALNSALFKIWPTSSTRSSMTTRCAA